jgi:hypothetical protein
MSESKKIMKEDVQPLAGMTMEQLSKLIGDRVVYVDSVLGHVRISKADLFRYLVKEGAYVQNQLQIYMLALSVFIERIPNK